MILKDFLPSPALRDFISSFGIVHFVFPKTEIIQMKSYSPRPGVSIEFFLRDPEYVQYPGDSRKFKRSSTIIVGQHTKLTNRFVGHDFLYFQIKFQPGAFFKLTGIPLNELTNTYIDADSVFPKDIPDITEQLKNALSYSEMIERAESFIVKLIQNKLIKESHRIDRTAKLLLQNNHHVSLDWLAKESCLSPKQFERKFLERVGINPSLFARIIRFENAFKMKNKNPNIDWLTIALHCGYYDYQHLTRDYKAFTELTPKSFSVLEEQAPERKLGLSEI